MFDRYLDCFQNNLAYIMKKQGMDYYEVYKPSIEFNPNTFNIVQSGWKDALSNVGFVISRYSTSNKSEFIKIFSKRNNLFSMVKTNVVDLPWSISSGSDDDDHWVTVWNGRIQDPYYDKYDLNLDVGKMIAHVVPNVGHHYTTFFFLFSNGKNFNIQNNKNNRCVVASYTNKLGQNLLEAIKSNMDRKERESELFYSNLLNIANARIQLYKHLKKNENNNSLLEKLLLSYQSWIALANIYFKIILGYYKWNEVSKRVIIKINEIVQIEKAIYKECQ
ncbi:hypothetical protein HU830_08575 [Lactobacillus sp. DCY120]|uniref:Uncharacterized protein n=1 Tax=Bombilactobacillus apium TaxID=2675299 RepID=A0A850R2N1_9LACO|nr:hypothetical protein [Bombilactobacillus apium]NVY97173.1 hypothetical protein [Bombilactobacillus apium]